MDLEIFSIVLFLLSICTILLSLVFRKRDRIKVIKTSALFLGLVISSLVAMYLLILTFPEFPKWMHVAIGTAMYSVILAFFVQKMIDLVDTPKVHEDTESKSDSSDPSVLLRSFEQKRGVASSDLNPIGTIQIDGQSLEARSTLGFISKGESIEVESSNGFELQVRKV